MANDWSSDLKHKFYIKCVVDICAFVATILLFIIFAKIKSVAPYDTFLFLIIVTIFNGAAYFITRQSMFAAINNVLNRQSSSIAEAVGDIANAAETQKKTLESLVSNTKNVTNLISSLKQLFNASASTSKNTERQINQSITFSNHLDFLTQNQHFVCV